MAFVSWCLSVYFSNACHPWKSNEYFHNCAHVNFSFISLWFSSATHYPNAFHKFLTINICLNQLRKKLMKMFWVFFHLTTLLMLVFLFYLQVRYVEMVWSNCVWFFFSLISYIIIMAKSFENDTLTGFQSLLLHCF